MSKAITITIDGPAGAGKSTTARRVAERLGYVYVDTGAMYRAVTLAALEANTPHTPQAMAALMPDVHITLATDDRGQRTYLNGRDVSDEIRRPDVTGAVSVVSAMPVVRRAMVDIQRTIGANGGVVMDGRDIGSVVFPGAELKIFLVADVAERVRRRLAEAQLRGEQSDEAAIRRQIVERDAYDSSREESPLVKPDGAIEIDTTNLTIDEQVDLIVDRARKYLSAYNLVSPFFKL
ncbi:MAG: (d)CMP kinase [Candidatus Kapabacteria bacterium]|nr:(d)CMP kinase [Candidatus Kapabacteria bacterium]